MKKILVVLLLSGCASHSGWGLKPGVATEADVRRVMGEPTTVRKAPDGGQVLWYPRQPYGGQSYAATLDPTGTLASIEQRLVTENFARVRPNETQAEQVLDLLGPPYRVYDMSGRKVWEYYTQTPYHEREVLYVQLSQDNVVREVIKIDKGGRSGLFFGFGIFGR